MKLLRPLLLSLALGSLASSVEAAPAGIDLADWRGSSEVLLTAGGSVYTERDLLLFTLLTESLDPAAARGWRDLNEERRQSVRDLLTGMVKTDWLAGQYDSSDDAASAALAPLATRILAGPAARWIWADSIVRQSVTIFPEDIVRAYQARPEEFMNPGGVTVLRLRVPFPPTLTVEAQNETRRLAEDLRSRAELQGGLAPILSANPEYLLDPPGQTVELRRTSKEADPALLEAAFALGMNQISQPIRTPSGMILVELIDRQEPLQVPLDVARERITAVLEQRFIPQQYDYLLGRRTAESYPSMNAHLYQFMPPEADLLRVREFALTKGDFNRMFHDQVGTEKVPNLLFISSRTEGIMLSEIVAQDLEAAGTLADPFYEDAVRMAGRVYAAREVVRQARRDSAPSAEEVEAYLDANLEALAPGVSRTTWRLDVFVRNSESLSLGESDAMQILMRTYLNRMTADATRQLDERRQLAANRGILEPDKVVSNLAQPDDLRVRTRFVRVGTVTREDSRRLTGLPFEQLQLGRFTEPTVIDAGSVSSFYVSEESSSPIPPRPVLLERAREALVDQLSVAGAQQYLDSLQTTGRLVFHQGLAPNSAANP